MKTSNYIYSSVLALGLTAGTVPVYGGENGPPEAPDVPTTPPGLNDTERTAYCLVESIASLVAAQVAHLGCGTRDYGVTVSALGSSGSATVDQVGLTSTLSGINVKGAFCDIKGSGELGVTEVGECTGKHAWKGNNTIFIDSAPRILLDGVHFDEHSIKDFYKAPENKGGFDVFDYGLEAITKFDYPRHKWWEQSKYRRENGSLDAGLVRIIKTRVQPRGCVIDLELEGTNDESFEYSGGVKVNTL